MNKVLVALGSRTEDIDERLLQILRRLEQLEQESQPEPRRKAG